LLKNHKAGEQGLPPVTESGNQSSKTLTHDEPWQSIGSIEIQFSLAFISAEPTVSLSVLLPCQCIQASASDQLPDSVAKDFSFVRFCLTESSQAQQLLLTNHSDLVLKLKHQQTWIEVSGHCSSYEHSNSLMTFAFEDASSMQARMILQLVKICQMRADMFNRDEQLSVSGRLANDQLENQNTISHAAKTWSDQFAADFAKKFDKNN
jgi:hypothetical protein